MTSRRGVLRILPEVTVEDFRKLFMAVFVFSQVYLGFNYYFMNMRLNESLGIVRCEQITDAIEGIYDEREAEFEDILIRLLSGSLSREDASKELQDLPTLEKTLKEVSSFIERLQKEKCGDANTQDVGIESIRSSRSSDLIARAYGILRSPSSDGTSFAR